MSEDKESVTLREAIMGVKGDPRRVLEAIDKGIDNSLGQGTSILVFKMLERVYHFDRNATVSNIELFDELIERLLGTIGAKVARKQIIRELERRKQN